MPTILQISDPHLMSQSDGTLKGVPTYECVQQVLDRARREVAEPDRVILTGDLSHEHKVSGYRMLEELLGEWNPRTLLIPGNHDGRAAMREVFSQVPGKGEEDIWFRDEIDGWRLIGLDTQIPGETSGELSPRTLARLERWLREDPQRPTLLFMHHPPVPVDSPWLDAIGLGNPEALEVLVRESPGIKAIFCGHVHQEFEGRMAGVPVFSAPSAAIQFLPCSREMVFDARPPGFRVIELQPHAFHSRVVRLEQAPFEPREV